MNARIALAFFLSICLLLAVLLLSGMITPIVSGIAFALALVVLGGGSGGFRRNSSEAKNGRRVFDLRRRDQDMENPG